MVVHKVSMCNAGSVGLVCVSPSVADILSAGCYSTGSSLLSLSKPVRGHVI